MRTKKQNLPNPGLAVDSGGNPVIDPTLNVMNLVEAAVKRLDDLREAESRRLTELAILREKYSEALTLAESKRIDAIRSVDVNAVAVASQKAADQAAVLAVQVAQSAEALRILVASTATTVATAQQQLGTALSARITVLEQSQYVGMGKQSYVDPMMAELILQVQNISKQQTLGTGKKEGISMSWAILAAVISTMSTLVSIGSILFAVLN